LLKYLTAQPGFINQYSAHRYMYNFSEMKKLLEFTGFTNVVECTHRVGRIPDVEKLDTKEESLFIEAMKSST
jgi:hypothetical protein